MRELLSLITNASIPPSVAAGSWDRFLPIIRIEGLLGRFATILDSTGRIEGCPGKVREQLRAAQAVVRNQERVLGWEVDRIGQALAGIDARKLLLKGAAYHAAGLPPARGRLASDVDILLPAQSLPEAEAALLEAGWEPVKLDAYDQRYYREWMHELPPLRHALRGTFVDVHHSILPLTSRLKPSSDRLLEASVPIDDSPFRMLCPCDMVLHSATHLFYDGEFDGGLRDLVDLHDLLTHFDTPEFWRDLVPRAVELNLERPLFYALRSCKRLLETPVPESVLEASKIGKPVAPTGAVMGVLTKRAILPTRPGENTVGKNIAHAILYLRAHYLRMPLHLLIPHLSRKAIARKQPDHDN